MDHASIEPLSRIFFQLGPITIYWYAIFIITGLLVATFLAIREGKKIGIKPDFFWDLVLYGLPISLIGARMYYVIFNWGYYLVHTTEIIQIWNGGLAIHGAILVVIIEGWFFAKWNKMQPWLLFDIAGPVFILAQAIGRFGNFMNQEAHGGIVPGATLDAQREFLQSLWIPDIIVNNMFINGNYYHPTFLYEAVWNVMGFLLMVFVIRKLKFILVGEIGAFYIGWYSMGRFFIEALRTDSLMLFGVLRMAQIISIVSIVIVVTLVIRRRKKKYNIVTYQSFYGGEIK